MTFDLVTSAGADQLRRAQLNPLDARDMNPSFFEGVVSAPLLGLARGALAKPAVFLGEAFTPAVRPITRDIDALFGTDMTGFLNDQSVQRVKALKSLTPDGNTTGMAGQVLHSLFDIVPTAVATGGIGAGVLEGVAQTKLAQERGVDERTAILHGAVQGVATGVGVAIPMSVGLRTAPDLVWAAASNILPNAAARGASHQLLAKAGYTEMAEQYKALDGEAILADGVMGVFFGAAGRVMHGFEARRADQARSKVMPSDLDAALTAKAAHHLELDSAPGVPRNLEARDAHVEAALKAADDLLAGRPVEVGTRVAEADFQADPARAQYAKLVHAETKAHLGDAYDRVLAEPLGPVNDPLVRITAEQIGEVLIERGPALPAKGEVEVKAGSFGLVKIIWKHGEKAKDLPATERVTREDVLRLPEVMNDFLPIRDETQADGKRALEWQVERQDGKRVLYAAAKFTQGDNQQHIVSIFMNTGREKRFQQKPLSETKNRPAAESPTVGSTPSVRDTGRASFSSPRGGQEDGAEKSIAPETREGQPGKTESLELALMHQAMKDKPDLMVMGEDGQLVKASDLAKAADEEAKAAKEMAKGFEAAAACFLRTGS